MTEKLKRTFLLLVEGLTSTSSIFTHAESQTLRGSDLERIRGDVCRVGKDFHKILAKENDNRTSAR